jgi:glycosyltransferase involved in cell wall biosynthesis
MKVFLLAPGENWIVDRFCQEWKQHNADVTTDNPREADVFWLIADWAYNHVPYEFLKTKRVLTSVHHIVPEKFGERELAEFAHRDAITFAYHVPCKATAIQVDLILAKLGVKKPIYVRPFWVNEKLWDSKPRFSAKALLGLQQEAFYVGSFQRDTEGKDLVSPKLEKGPDRFCDAVETLQRNGKNPTPLLGGWRRQYVTNRLTAANIPFVYKELPEASVISWMYAACDLYVVGSRYEGGPQAIFECANMKVPIVSTDVGAASEILHQKSIFDPNSEQSLLDAVEFALTEEAVFHASQTVKQHHFEPSFQWFRNHLGSLT